MFCLRSWIPILFFLTNASPIYLILFISATYVLNRPCVYCSLLLAILVIALFDFRSDWFEPRYHTSPLHSARPAPPSSSSIGANHSQSYNPSFGFMESLSILSSALNETAAAVVGSVVGSIKGKAVQEVQSAVNGTVVEWVKGLLRREWRISCLGLVIRL